MKTHLVGVWVQGSVLLTGTYQMETQTSLGLTQMDVMEQLDMQVPVPLQEESSTSQNLQSLLIG